ncbi:MAG: CoA-binding protein [Bacteriovorax sp.]
MKTEKKSVLVFGYSDKPERYSYKAYHLLREFNQQVSTFNPRIDDPKSLIKDFDTLTLYVSEEISNKFEDVILGLNFKRVIFNPGTENINLEEKLKKKKVEIVHGCTLVMLRTDQF